MDMASTEELGLVWMGDMLLHNDPGGIMLNSTLDPHRHGFFSEAQQAIEEARQATPVYVQDMNGFMMIDELEDPYYEETEDESNIKSMTTSATQTAGNVAPSRKIKPIKHPALKLQTPIAYQRDTDINVIPIQRDGMAVCEKCGAIGVKHAFYTRERRFCSLACARCPTTDSQNPSSPQDNTDPLSNSQGSGSEMEIESFRAHHSLPPLPPPPPLPEDEPLFPPDKKTQTQLIGTYEWTDMLSEPGFSAAPVSAFMHVARAIVSKTIPHHERTTSMFDSQLHVMIL